MTHSVYHVIMAVVTNSQAEAVEVAEQFARMTIGLSTPDRVTRTEVVQEVCEGEHGG